MDGFEARTSLIAPRLRPEQVSRHAMLVWLLGPLATASWIGAWHLVAANHAWDSLSLVLIWTVFVIYGNVCAALASILLFTRREAWGLPETWSVAVYWAWSGFVLANAFGAISIRGVEEDAVVTTTLVVIAAGPVFALGRLAMRTRAEAREARVVE